MINLTKKQLAIIIGIGGLIIFVIGYYIYSLTSEQSYEQIETISEEQTTKSTENVENDTEEIVIHIAGEVKKPGIVRIKDGARIADIIDQAGGLTEKADITNINLAYIIEDGQKITIPSKEAQEEENKEHISNESGQETSQDNTQTLQTININKANSEQLQTLPGIGESTATKIIEYRTKNGAFKQIEDLKNVAGIGDAKFEAIKDSIKIK